MKADVIVGVALGVVGAALDFLSGLGLMGYGVGMVGSVQLLSGLALIALGVVVLGVGLMIAMPKSAQRMGLLGGLMEVCGILMGFASTYIPLMGGGVADAMLIVAILMFLNGLLMQSRRKNRGMQQTRSGQHAGTSV